MILLLFLKFQEKDVWGGGKESRANTAARSRWNAGSFGTRPCRAPRRQYIQTAPDQVLSVLSQSPPIPALPLLSAGWPMSRVLPLLLNARTRPNASSLRPVR